MLSLTSYFLFILKIKKNTTFPIMESSLMKRNIFYFIRVLQWAFRVDNALCSTLSTSVVEDGWTLITASRKPTDQPFLIKYDDLICDELKNSEDFTKTCNEQKTINLLRDKFIKDKAYEDKEFLKYENDIYQILMVILHYHSREYPSKSMKRLIDGVGDFKIFVPKNYTMNRLPVGALNFIFRFYKTSHAQLHVTNKNIKELLNLNLDRVMGLILLCSSDLDQMPEFKESRNLKYFWLYCSSDCENIKAMSSAGVPQKKKVTFRSESFYDLCTDPKNLVKFRQASEKDMYLWIPVNSLDRLKRNSGFELETSLRGRIKPLILEVKN